MMLQSYTAYCDHILAPVSEFIMSRLGLPAPSVRQVLRSAMHQWLEMPSVGPEYMYRGFTAVLRADLVMRGAIGYVLVIYDDLIRMDAQWLAPEDMPRLLPGMLPRMQATGSSTFFTWEDGVGDHLQCYCNPVASHAHLN